MGRSRITLARYASQAAFLGLFLWLFLSTESTGQDTLGPPVRLFLDFDPLIFLSTVLAAHAAPAAFFLSLITLGLTAVLGRAFCGWVCPLGTLHNVASRFNRRTARPLGVHWLKYLVLFFVLGAAAFGAELAGGSIPYRY
jgi:polyferredoxin